MKARESVPQADSLPRLRRCLEELATLADWREAAAAAGAQERHVNYYRVAAEVLRLVHGAGAVMQLQPLARTLLATAHGSAAEASTWRRAVEQSPLLRRLVPNLLGPSEPSLEHICAVLETKGNLSGATVPRRAKALLSWRAQILAAERQMELPLARRVERADTVRYSGPTMLRSLRIESFKAFGKGAGSKAEPAAVAVGPLTMLAGPNGAGKSTILQAIDIVGALVRGNITEMLKEHEWDYEDLPHLRAANQTIRIGVEVELGAAVLEWELSLGTRRHPGIAAETVRFRNRDAANWTSLLERRGRKVRVLREPTGTMESLPPMTLAQSWLSTRDAADDEEAFPGLVALKLWAERIRAFWSLHPSVLRAPSRKDDARIGSHGEGLANFLFDLRKRDSTSFNRFVKRVRRYYPRLVDIEPKSGQYGWKYLSITERWNGEKATFNARQVSDGLLRILVIASLPEWKVPPSIVLMDEIENGLHPRLIGSVAELLAEISRTTQVVATTHSPITLNYVSAETARLVTRGRGGAVVVTPLTETNGYGRLREHFEPGELWYNVGEERLLAKKGGR